MNQEKKNKLLAGLGSIAFHALLLLLLFFLALKTPLPLPEEEGVEVDMGYSALGKTTPEKPLNKITPPQPTEIPAETTKASEPTKSNQVEEKIVQTDSEETPAIAEKPKKKKKAVVKPIEKPKEEAKKEIKKETKIKKKVIKPKPKPKPQAVVDPRLMYTGARKASQEGSDEQAGDKGIEKGSLDAKNYEGPGGKGNKGISYNLGNRKANTLPKPTYNSNDQGRVNVSIWVDKNGNVTRAEILQKGTTVSDIRLKNMAKQAALKAHFAADPEAPEIQKGVISYNFIKLN